MIEQNRIGIEFIVNRFLLLKNVEKKIPLNSKITKKNEKKSEKVRILVHDYLLFNTRIIIIRTVHKSIITITAVTVIIQ